MILNTNGYYHPSEIVYLFNESQEPLFKNITMKEWLEYYIDVCNGSILPNNDIERERYNIMESLYKDVKSNRDKIISLGFNPDLPNTYDSIEKQTYRLYEYMNRETLEVTTESNKSKANIYVVLSRTNSRTSTIINKVTGDEYTHSSFSFDHRLNNMYSFNGEGFVKESIEEFKRKFGDIQIAVFSATIDNVKYSKIETRILNYVSKQKKMHYSVLGLLGVLLNKPIIFDNFKFCSEFVDELLKIADIDILNKPSGLTRPQDFKDNKVLKKIYEGKISGYDINKIKYKHSLIENNILKEFKTTVEFNDNGDFIVKNIHKLDIEDEYQKSHKLLLSYEKTNNYDAMKYEISKLWYLNYKLEDEMKNSDSDKRKLKNTRTRVLNDFNKYLKIINKNDKNFNFGEYYNESIFNDNNIKVSKNTIFNTIDILKRFVI